MFVVLDAKRDSTTQIIQFCTSLTSSYHAPSKPPTSFTRNIWPTLSSIQYLWWSVPPLHSLRIGPCFFHLCIFTQTLRCWFQSKYFSFSYFSHCISRKNQNVLNHVLNKAKSKQVSLSKRSIPFSYEKNRMWVVLVYCYLTLAMH